MLLVFRLYAKTGARYFVALANHHGNFDCWDSKHQPWNCVNVGPKKDIVGTWGKIARAHGLRFGITVHGTPGRVWREFMPVRYGSDDTGPMKGMLRVQDLIDKYGPDLLYFDDNCDWDCDKRGAVRQEARCRAGDAGTYATHHVVLLQTTAFAAAVARRRRCSTSRTFRAQY